MGSSSATSEIVELDDDSGFAQHFNKLSIEVKAEAEEEDLNQLMKSFELRNSYRVSGSTRHNISLDKRASKELIKGGPSQASGVSNSESVTLKQALRKLCVSQASEMAAMKKKSSRSSCLLPDISEAGTVKRLLASVVVPTTESEAEKGNRVETTFVPKKMLEVSQSSNQIPELPKVKIKVPRIQDVISEPTEESSSSTSVKEIKRKEKSISNNSTANKPMIIKPVVNKVTNVKKKVKKEQASTKQSKTSNAASVSSQAKCKCKRSESANDKTTNAAPISSQAKCKCKYSESAKDKTTNAASVSSQAKCKNSECAKDKDDNALQETNAATPSSCKSGAMNSRKREKGESSQSSKSSIGDYSTSTSLSDDSHQNSSGSNGSRPHMSKDVKWKAIRDVTNIQNGNLGLSDFKLVKRLGCGDIGTVYLAELSGSDCMFALKVMDVEFLISRKKMLRAQTEREILQMLDHPFLPTLYANFTTDNLSCLVMEYCPGGDLHVLRQRQPRRCFSEPAARFYVAEVLLALEYLHMLGVIYRDLKPENILVREDGHIMLSDFDLSLRCKVSPTLLQSTAEPIKRPSYPCPQNDCIAKPICLQNSWTHSSCFSPRLTPSYKTHKHAPDPLPQLIVEPIEARSNSFVGTHEYLAPEIIRGDGHGSAVDWWTFGIFLYELLYGKTPFKGANNDETLTNVISQSMKFPESGSVSFHARDLIGALLVKEPENRLGSNRGAAEIKQHPFFEGLNWALIRCASPPEVLKSSDIKSAEVGGSKRKKEGMCLGMRSYGNDAEFEMF